MAKFTDAEWRKIHAMLDSDGERFGLPELRNGSVVLASFNIRKLGKVKDRSAGAWTFLKRFCERCDLIAVQEVANNLEGLNYLKELLGDRYGIVASDITTGLTFESIHMTERLAYLYRWDRVERTEVASYVTYDRKKSPRTESTGRDGKTDRKPKKPEQQPTPLAARTKDGMNDVFISYASEDRNWVRMLVQALEGHGWSVWWDREIHFGKPFAEVIADELAKARCVIVVWSTVSAKKRWVQAEASYGFDKNILFPVHMNSVKPPLPFNLLHGVDMADWHGEEDHVDFQRLVTAISDKAAQLPEKAGTSIAAARGTRKAEAPVAAKRQVEEVEADRAASQATYDLNSFVRAPFCVSFRIPGAAGSRPYEFLAITAHLKYSDRFSQRAEREMEFRALMRWLIARAQQAKCMYHKDMILLGDLNLDFDQVDARRSAIEAELRSLNKGDLAGPGQAKLNFPFLDIHPLRRHIGDRQQAVWRSNIRQTQTYDQIAIFMDDKRLPNHEKNETAGLTPDGFDYRVFDYSDLFAEALHGKPLAQLTKDQVKALLSRFEHDVSDHMPIWIRLPKP